MPNIIKVTDFNSPQLDVYVRLTGAELRRSKEAERGIFIAESPMVIEVALDAGCEPISLLTDERLLEGSAKKIIERVDDVPRRYPCENKSAGYRLAQAIAENDENNKVFSVHVWTNYIEVLPHIFHGIEFTAEIIVHGRPLPPVK